MDILTFRHCDVKMTSQIIFFMNLNSGPKISLSTKFELDQVIILKIIQVFFVFSMPKMTWHTVNKRLLWQHLIRMVIDQICKMTVKGVKSKSESFFSISHDVLELWRKTLGGRIPPSPPPPAWIGLKKITSLICLFATQSTYLYDENKTASGNGWYIGKRRLAYYGAFYRDPLRSLRCCFFMVWAKYHKIDSLSLKRP